MLSCRLPQLLLLLPPAQLSSVIWPSRACNAFMPKIKDLAPHFTPSHPPNTVCAPPAGAVAAADPCGSLNFFPTASQITGLTGASASVAVNADVTCTGNQVCNWPSVVNKTAQESYQAELGTSVAAGGLLSVAVKEYSGKQLKIFFRPVSPLLTQNANAQSCVLAKTPAATRKLTQASTYSVATPGTWSYTATLSSGGTIPGGSRAATATGDLTFSTEGAVDVSVVLDWGSMHLAVPVQPGVPMVHPCCDSMHSLPCAWRAQQLLTA